MMALINDVIGVTADFLSEPIERGKIPIRYRAL